MSTLSVRRPLAVLAVLAMVATLLFAVAGTAGAADPVKPSNPATFSACPDNANIPDAGFTDIPTASFFDDSVNCLAYYAVTKGTTPTTYDPAADVTRAQMAVFLYRMAGVAGVVLNATPPDAGFTDISGLSAEAQLAINSLAAKGIVKGKTTTTYAPADTVWRQQMALFLKRFSDAASAPTTGPGGTQAKNTTGTTNNFTDLGSVTVEADTAINDVFQLGVAAGNTATTFDPLGNVNRGQMSLFLTRLAAHMNVRPSGANIQADPMTDFGPFASEVSVTVRGTDFLPVTGSHADIWRFNPTTAVTSPFNANGTCNLASGTILVLQGGGAACTLETIDPTMDPYGNWPVFVELATNGKTSDLYAWTGTVGSTFNSASTAYSAVTLTSTTGATDATLKSTLPKYATVATVTTVKWGTNVTLTVQLMDGTGDTAKPVAEADVEYKFTDSKTTNAVFVGTTTTTVKTDATGKATYTVTQSDPATAVGDTGVNYVTVTPIAPVVLAPTFFDLRWSDAASVATTAVASTAVDYKIQSNGAGNNAMGTVYDQYGMGMAGESVIFSSTDTAAGADGIGAPGLATTATTNGAGVAILGYTWTHTGAIVTGQETISVDAVSIGAPATVEDTTDFYWVNKAPDGANAAAGTPVLVADIANKKVVGVLGADTWEWTWAAGDQFWINGHANTGTQAQFEEQVALTGALFQVENYLDVTAGISTFTSGP